jgi:uroporphyrinogen-III synthase
MGSLRQRQTIGLRGLRVVSFESRRSQEMANLIRNHGGEPIETPSMQEIPLTEQSEVLEFGEALLAGGCDVLILLTGVGTRMLVDTLATRWPREVVLEALGKTALVCRGPKPVSALKKVGLHATITVGEPNTWRDLLQALDDELPVSGKRVAVQEYGARNQELLDGLQERDAVVTPVPVYAWALPDDTAPLKNAIERAVAGEIDAAVFTSATQADHLFQVAKQQARAEELREAFRSRILVASIGPMTSEALTRLGVEADIVPEHPKMGHLVMALAEGAVPGLELKRSRG